MKRGRLISGLTLLVAFNAAPIVADEVSQRLESIVIDTFDDPEQRVWTETGKEMKEARNWVATGSKFSTKDYPVLKFVETWPTALFDNNPDKLPLKSLGIMGEFDRKGFNYIEIYPVKKNEAGTLVPYSIALPGIAQAIDVWVWGSNYKFTLEVHVRDYRGIPYILDAGSLYFEGWRNLRVNIPTYIPQTQPYLPRYRGLTLTKFVVRTDPTERVTGGTDSLGNILPFYFYMDQLKVLTDMQQTPFDGREVLRPDFIEKNWATNPQQGK